MAEDANYLLYTLKKHDKGVKNWFFPTARLITSFAALEPELVLDLVPTGTDGQFKLTSRMRP